jgi:hypothetical protein
VLSDGISVQNLIIEANFIQKMPFGDTPLNQGDLFMLNRDNNQRDFNSPMLEELVQDHI